MHRSSWALLLVGILGLAGFFYLFPRYDPSARYDVQLDRSGAVEKALDLGRRLGVELGEFDSYAKVQPNEPDLYYLLIQGADPGPFVSPVTLNLRLEAEEGPEFLDVYLTNDGRPLRIERRRVDPPEEDEAEVGEPGPQDIQRALELIAGSDWIAYEQSEEPEVRNGRTTLEFRAPDLAGTDRVPRVVIQAVGSEVYLVRGYPGFSNDFDSRFDDLEDSVEALLALLVLVTILGIICAIGRYIVAVFDRVAEYRQVIILIALSIVADLLFFAFGEGWQTAGVDEDGIAEIILLKILQYIFVILPMIVAVWGTGTVVTGSRAIAGRIHADLLLKGLVLVRPVGRAIALGGFMGGALAGIPLVLTAAEIFSNALPGLHEPQGWFSWIPALVFLKWVPEGPFLLIFGVVSLAYPWLQAHVERNVFLVPLRIAILTFFLGIWGFQISLPAALSTAFVGALLIDWIYRQSGLLATLSCGIVATVLRSAMAMLVQPAPDLSFQGGIVLLLVFAGLTAFSLIAVRGREIDLDEVLRRAEGEIEKRASLRKAEREQLLAEFGVARRAQELMLPEAPPRIEGLDIAAACTPAREVGGDLFDFLRLRDGRTSIVVADVSGKGVPAALYMTLAKGLLSSVAEAESSPARIVQQVNEHFHGCAQKRVFATLAMAVLDSEQGIVECARAGHNPILWRHASNGEIRTVNPSGIGLGLAPNRLFSRSLSVESCRVKAGDTLIIYSDGIPEAMNERKEEYGMERFMEAIRETSGMNAEQSRDHLLQRVRDFVGQTPPSDDVTLVIIQFLDQWGVRRVG